VDRYIRTGEFGLCAETGELNEWIIEAGARQPRLGEDVGRPHRGQRLPHRDLSVFAAAYRAGIPVTVHAGSATTLFTSIPLRRLQPWARPAIAIF